MTEGGASSTKLYSASYELDSPEPFLHDWNEWISVQSVGAGFCQTSHWARIHAAVNGATPVVVTVKHDGRLMAGALFGLQPRAAAGAAAWLLGLTGGRELVCHEGPVLAEGSDDQAEVLLAELLERVEAAAKGHGVRAVRFSGPPPLAGWMEHPEIPAVFDRFGYTAKPWLTSVVDLTPDEDSLRDAMKHAARKGIRKCGDAGVSVRVCVEFADYMQAFCASYYSATAGGLTADATRRCEAFWNAQGGQHYRFFVAEHAGQVLATLGTYAFNGVATEIMSARTRAGEAASLPAQDLLHWEVFRAHKAAGDHWFNLAGYSPDPQTGKEAGIRRFKEKWGGIVRSVPQFIRLLEPLPIRFLRSAKRLVRP